MNINIKYTVLAFCLVGTVSLRSQDIGPFSTSDPCITIQVPICEVHWSYGQIVYSSPMWIEYATPGNPVYYDGNIDSTGSGIGYNIHGTVAYIQICPDCPDVATLTAADPTHSTRVATAGQTLYVVGHNDAVITATAEGGSFPEDCPEWEGAGAPADGTTSFTDTSASNRTFTTGGKSVTVVRKQEVSFNFTPGNVDSLDLVNKTKNNFKFPGATAEFSVSLDLGQTSWSSSLSEKYNSPNYGLKTDISLGFSGSVSGRIEHPLYSGDLGFAEYAVYGQATATLGLGGSIGYDASEANPWTSENLTMTFTGSVEIGADAEVNLGWHKIVANVNASSSATGQARLSGDEIQGKLSWDGVNGNLSIIIYKDDPMNPDWTLTGTYNLWEGGSTNWGKIYSLSEQPTNP